MKKDIWIAALSGLQYSYNTTIIAATLLFVTQAFSLSVMQEGLVASITLLGALCTAAMAGMLADRIGRRASLGLSTVLFIAGCALSMLATSTGVLLGGRILVGFGTGLATVVTPLYIVEVAPPERRGASTNLYQLGIAFGALLAYIVGYWLSESGNWRLMFGLGIAPGIIQFLGLFFIPESRPVGVGAHPVSWSALWAPAYRSRFKLGLILFIFQALSGASALFFFAPRVFQSSGGCEGATSALKAALWPCIAYAVAMLLSTWLIDRLGRRRVLLVSLVGMIVSLLTVVVAVFWNLPHFNQVLIVSLMVACAAYAFGLGPVPPLVVGEITPDALRGTAMTVTGLTGWLSNYLIVLTFLPLVNALSLSSVFGLYAAFCAMALVLVLRRLPETKQKSLEEIDRLFKAG